MTSDKLDEVPRERAEIFARLLRERRLTCYFPQLGIQGGKTIIQEAARPDGSMIVNLFNVGSDEERVAAGAVSGLPSPIVLPPHASHLLELAPGSRTIPSQSATGTA